MFLDEIHLDEKTEGAAIDAAAVPSRDVSFPTMVFGLLTKRILPDATVLGFSRSGSTMNTKFLSNESEVYSIKELSWEDVVTFIEKTTEDEELRKKILQHLEEFAEELQNDILFLKHFVKIAHEENSQLREITSVTTLFLTIIRGNLDYQMSRSDLGFCTII